MNRRATPWIIAAMLLLTQIMAVSAGILDRFKLGGAGRYFTGKMLVNYLVIFIALMLIYELVYKKLLGGSEGSTEGKQKYFMWILLFILAVVIASHLAPAGDKYVWEGNGPLTGIKLYMFGDVEKQTASCDGDGAYSQDGICRQGILRVNGEKGIGTFLIALIASIFLLQLGKVSLTDDSDSKMGKGINYALAALLAGMIANEGMTRSSLIRFLGVTIIFTVYGKLKKSEGSTEGHGPKVAGALSYAIVETVANMLGTSIVMGTHPGQVTSMTLMMNFAIGFLLSWAILGIKKHGEAKLEKLDTEMDDDRKKERDKRWNAFREALASGNRGEAAKQFFKAAFRSIPTIGALSLPDYTPNSTLWQSLEKATDVYLKALTADPSSQATQDAKDSMDALEEVYNQQVAAIVRAFPDVIEYNRNRHRRATERPPQLERRIEKFNRAMEKLRE